MGNIVIKKYDEKDLDHRYIMVSLDNDEQFNKFIGDSYYLIANMDANKRRGLDNQIYIAYIDNEPVGLLEHDILDEKIYIKVGIIPDKRGNHYGRTILSYFLDYLFSMYPGSQEIYASINPNNLASIKTFNSLGFEAINKIRYVKSR